MLSLSLYCSVSSDTLQPSGLPPRTFAWTVSSELLGFHFFLIFVFLVRALDKAGHLVSFERTLIHRIMSYLIV